MDPHAHLSGVCTDRRLSRTRLSPAMHPVTYRRWICRILAMIASWELAWGKSQHSMETERCEQAAAASERVTDALASVGLSDRRALS